MRRRSNVAVLVICTLVAVCAETNTAARGTLTIQTVDSATKKPIPARIHIKDHEGKPVQVPRITFWKDHHTFDGQIRLSLRDGIYTFEIEHGPEYRVHRGNFVMNDGAKDTQQVLMRRFVNMAEEGWYSGDMHIHRPVKDVPLLIKAEDLYVAPVITWWNAKNLWQDELPPERLIQKVEDEGRTRYMHVLAGEDERDGGALLYFNLPNVFDITRANWHYPSSMKFLMAIGSRHPAVHVDIEKPFWWDVPVWIASGRVHSIGICNNHMMRSKMLENEAWGKKRDERILPPPHGNGRWSQQLYYKILNTGHRIAPSAGSASGVLDNPVGYNRVYVHCGEDFTYERWFENLRKGQVVVTNGPMMRPLVNGELPGHIFEVLEGESIDLEASLNLSLREKVEYLEIVKNGEVVEHVRLQDYAQKGGRLPSVHFEKSGWMLIRCVTENEETYRFASSGPYYVEVGEKRRISAESTQFFVDWLKERGEAIANEEKLSQGQKDDLMRYYTGARQYWESLNKRSNAP